MSLGSYLFSAAEKRLVCALETQEAEPTGKRLVCQGVCVCVCDSMHVSVCLLACLRRCVGDHAPVHIFLYSHFIHRRNKHFTPSH